MRRQWGLQLHYVGSISDADRCEFKGQELARESSGTPAATWVARRDREENRPVAGGWDRLPSVVESSLEHKDFILFSSFFPSAGKSATQHQPPLGGLAS